MLGRLIESVRAGKSRVRAVRGEPGMGKTALLDCTPEQARGCQVLDILNVFLFFLQIFSGQEKD